MTANRDANGNYTNPLRPNAGGYPSVTTIISAGVPKGGLENWIKRTVAEYAVDNIAAWRDLDRSAAVDLIKRASDRVRDGAGERGTLVHEVLEAHATGITPDPLLHADVIGYVNAGLAFLREWQPDIMWSEVEVFSDSHRYAGTLDLLAYLPGLGWYLLDWKTANSIRASVGLQLAGYRNADYAVIDGEAHPIPEVIGGAAIHLRADGTYSFVPVDCGDEEWRGFLHAVGVAAWRRDRENVVVGKPLPAPGGANVLAARADWLRSRVATVIAWETPRNHPVTGAVETAGEVLARNWPDGVPTLREGGHDKAGLDAIAHIVSLVEAAFAMPFPPADPNTDRVEKAEAEGLADRLRRLPNDLVDAINETGRTMNVPPLLSGRLNRGQFDNVVQLVDDAEQVAAARAAEAAPLIFDICGEDPGHVEAIERACHANGGVWTPQALDALLAIRDHMKKGLLAFDGGVLCTVDAEGHLVDWFGGKRPALTALKSLADTFGLPKPKSVADAASNPTLVALAGASVAA